VLYTSNNEQHAMIVRSTPVSPATLGTQVDSLLTAITTLLTTTVIDEVQFAASGSNIFNPVVTGIEGNSYGSGGVSAPNAAFFLSFVGRTSGGRRARLFVFGYNGLGGGDYRLISGESIAADAGVVVINGATGSFLAVDGLKPVYKSYVNTGMNAHWQKALRP
jgi:hypothetical protein